MILTNIVSENWEENIHVQKMYRVKHLFRRGFSIRISGLDWVVFVVCICTVDFLYNTTQPITFVKMCNIQECILHKILYTTMQCT